MPFPSQVCEGGGGPSDRGLTKKSTPGSPNHTTWLSLRLGPLNSGPSLAQDTIAKRRNLNAKASLSPKMWAPLYVEGPVSPRSPPERGLGMPLPASPPPPAPHRLVVVLLLL